MLPIVTSLVFILMDTARLCAILAWKPRRCQETKQHATYVSLQLTTQMKQMEQEPTQRKNVKLCIRKGQVLAIKHYRRRELWILLAVLNRALFCKRRTSSEVDFDDSTMDVVWLDNGNSGDIYKFQTRIKTKIILSTQS